MMFRISQRDVQTYMGSVAQPEQLGDNREAIIENREAVSQMSLQKAKEEGAEIQGDKIALYHGTRSGKKIYQSKILNSGSYMSSDYDISSQFSNSAQQRGKAEVIKVYVPASSVFPSGNKYWSLNESINLNRT